LRPELAEYYQAVRENVLAAPCCHKVQNRVNLGRASRQKQNGEDN
jgi:hypothetical protein